jgi:hypothetical protein
MDFIFNFLSPKKLIEISASSLPERYTNSCAASSTDQGLIRRPLKKRKTDMSICKFTHKTGRAVALVTAFIAAASLATAPNTTYAQRGGHGGGVGGGHGHAGGGPGGGHGHAGGGLGGHGRIGGGPGAWHGSRWAGGWQGGTAGGWHGAGPGRHGTWHGHSGWYGPGWGWGLLGGALTGAAIAGAANPYYYPYYDYYQYPYGYTYPSYSYTYPYSYSYPYSYPYPSYSGEYGGTNPPLSGDNIADQLNAQELRRGYFGYGY